MPYEDAKPISLLPADRRIDPVHTLRAD